MKTITNIVGYLSALSTAIYVVLKFGYLQGAMTFMIITGILLSLYFPLYILDKLSDSSEGKTLPVHVVAAFCALVITLAVLFWFQQWHLAGTLFIIGLAGFSFVFIPMMFFHKAKQSGANNLMNGAGAIGLMAFSSGALFKIEHWPGALLLFTVAQVFIFLIYLPLYLKNSSTRAFEKASHFRDTIFGIIFGYLLFLFVYGTIMHWRVTADYAKPEIEVSPK